MLWLILVIVVVLAVGAGVTLTRRAAKAALPGRKAPLLERTVADVKVNDIVQHHGKDFLVEGIIKYDEDGHDWRAARTVDQGNEHWFVVGLERVSSPTVKIMQRVKELDQTAYPPETLQHGDVQFRLAQRGTANAIPDGELGDLPVKGNPKGSVIRCRWWRYTSAGDKMLLIEQWGDTYRALVGQTVAIDDVELLAAS